MIPELSVIVPFVNEMPQVAFTAQALYNELTLREGISFEVILIDNSGPEVWDQGRREPDNDEENGGLYFEKLIREERTPWIRLLKYPDKLSHWNCKRVAVDESRSPFLFFLDAHCLLTPGSLSSMFSWYKDNHEELNGSLHLPWSYLLDKPDALLEYRIQTCLEGGHVHYTSKTQSYRIPVPYRVPCMSTCGMMMSRDLLLEVGTWPSSLGIYGGGENYLNFTMAVLGKTVNIFPGHGAFQHWAAPRGYRWNWADWHKNRMIATYIFGGRSLVMKFAQRVHDEVARSGSGNPQIAFQILKRVLQDPLVKERARDIETRKVIDIETYVKDWAHADPQYVEFID